jgi:toxin YoeB
VVEWKVVFTKQAQKDAKKLSSSDLKSKAKELLQVISTDPYQTPLSYEKLFDLSGLYSRRINIKHRLVYQVYEKKHTIKVLRL